MLSASESKVNLNDLSAAQRIELTKSTYSDTSYFQTLFDCETVEVDCRQHSADLRGEIERILLEKNLLREPIELEKLHEVLSDDMKAYNFNDGVNKISTHFYGMDKKLEAVYHQFILFLRHHFLKEAFWFQATPTIRIHCPNSENSHHYPRYHSDISYGHPPEEINIWIPLTEIMEGHGFRLMNLQSSNTVLNQFDYDFTAFIHSAIHDKGLTKDCDNLSQAVTTPFGKMLAFDSRCIHTGEPLKEHTRISMDIRIIPNSRYETMNIQYQGSGRRKILFQPGHCYHEYDSDQLINHLGR